MSDKPFLILKKKWQVDHFGLLSSWGSQEEECCKWRGIRCSKRTDHVIFLNLHAHYLSGNWAYLSGKKKSCIGVELKMKKMKGFLAAKVVLFGWQEKLHWGGVEDEEDGNDFWVQKLFCLVGKKIAKVVWKLFAKWKGKVSKYSSILGLLKCIDLSSNKLVGQIPQELASLEGLISLNLSRNNLTGRVFQKIGQMQQLESLDLSRNQLSGALPIGLGSLHFISFLDLSSNNFLGKIPLSTQLQTFNASMYVGNDKLCGVLLNECPEDESTSVPRTIDHDKGYTNEEDADTFVTKGFYVSVVLGFVTGFWGLLGPLML
ncbi:hypothetical protein LguiA_029314 [Lonicera macranthoides]